MRLYKILRFLIKRRLYYAIRNSRLVWFYILNRKSRGVYRKSCIKLSAVEKRVADDLKKNGIALASLEEFFPGENVLDTLKKYSAPLRAEAEVKNKKSFLKFLFDLIPVLDFQNPFLALALDEKILTIIAKYYGLAPKFRGLTLNITTPIPEQSMPIDSQRWHRDPEDKVVVNIYNKELGINKKVEIGDINAFDNEKLDAAITLPDNAEEKQYDLTLSVYDEDNDIYENDEDDKSIFTKEISLDEGSCSTVPAASITASLQSDAKAGEELIVKATIVNTASEAKTFSLSAGGYADWASSATLNKNSVTLDAGESQDVLVTLNVNKGVSGEKKFNIELVEGNKFMSQPVSVSIENLSGLPSLTGLFAGIGGDNWYLWGIGALNVLLVLIIIIVAIKVAKKKE